MKSIILKFFFISYIVLIIFSKMLPDTKGNVIEKKVDKIERGDVILSNSDYKLESSPFGEIRFLVRSVSEFHIETEILNDDFFSIFIPVKKFTILSKEKSEFERFHIKKATTWAYFTSKVSYLAFLTFLISFSVLIAFKEEEEYSVIDVILPVIIVIAWWITSLPLTSGEIVLKNSPERGDIIFSGSEYSISDPHDDCSLLIFKGKQSGYIQYREGTDIFFGQRNSPTNGHFFTKKGTLIINYYSYILILINYGTLFLWMWIFIRPMVKKVVEIS